MNFLPSPLHPAVVHFPIVLIAVGSVAAVIAVWTARGQLRAFTAVLLALGALGTVAAVSTGEEDGEAVERVAATESLLDAHQQWAERTEVAAVAAAVLAIAALVAVRWPAVRRATSIACAVAAATASVCVYETGHRGGQLVYRHAAGVNLARTDALAASPASARAHRSHRDD